jgi:NAD(P)-dependent dehydrogenase (short-subunit alcohol dehydrogenase family)
MQAMLYPYSTMSPTAITQKVAIVTGAAQGIGKAISLRLAEEGYDIALVDLLGSKKLLEAVASEVDRSGQRAIALTADVSSEAEVFGFVNRTVTRFGRVDGQSPA